MIPMNGGGFCSLPMPSPLWLAFEDQAGKVAKDKRKERMAGSAGSASRSAGCWLFKLIFGTVLETRVVTGNGLLGIIVGMGD